MPNEDPNQTPGETPPRTRLYTIPRIASPAHSQLIPWDMWVDVCYGRAGYAAELRSDPEGYTCANGVTYVPMFFKADDRRAVDKPVLSLTREEQEFLLLDALPVMSLIRQRILVLDGTEQADREEDNREGMDDVKTMIETYAEFPGQSLWTPVFSERTLRQLDLLAASRDVESDFQEWFRLEGSRNPGWSAFPSGDPPPDSDCDRILRFLLRKLNLEHGPDRTGAIEGWYAGTPQRIPPKTGDPAGAPKDDGDGTAEGTPRAPDDPRAPYIDPRKLAKVQWLARAMMLVQAHPDWPDARIAKAVNRNPAQLNRSPEYKKAAALARKLTPERDVPRGRLETDEDGRKADVDAYDHRETEEETEMED